MTGRGGIAFSIMSGQIGGGQRIAFWVAQEIARRGIPLHVLSPDEGPSTDWFVGLGAKVHIIEHPRSYELWKMGRIARVLVANDIGTVYTHTTPVQEAMIGLAAKRAGCRLVIHRHSQSTFSAHRVLRQYQQSLWRMSLRLADQIVCVSEHLAEEVHSSTELRAPVVPNGIPIPDQGVFPHQPKTIGFIGRLDPNKRVEDFILAAAAVHANHPELRFLVAGSALHEDPYEADCRRLAERSGLQDVLSFLGEVAPGDPFLDGIDILVLPSLFEGHPLTPLEAMARGKAVIVTDLPGMRESIVDEVEGFVVPVRRPDEIAKRIVLLIHDTNKAIAMGEAARRRAIRDFSLERFLADAVPLVLGEGAG